MNNFLIPIMNKLLWGGFVFSCIGVLFYLARFITYFLRQQHFVLTKGERIALGIYIAYLIMSIFTGIRL
jgi:hypothetical protein